MATYYVDQTGGSDASADPTSISTPWKTISKVNSSSFTSDDQILFKKGETWRELLTVPSAGTSGHPITFGAYSTGAAPIINGSDIVTAWTFSTPYYYKDGLSSPLTVFENNVRLVHAASHAALAAGQWWWTGTRLEIRCTADADPATKTMEIALRSGISLNNKDYVTIDGIEIKQGNSGIHVLGGSAYVTVQNLTSSWNNWAGVYVTDSGTDHFTATSVTAHDNVDSGILVDNGPDLFTVSGGTFYNHLGTYSVGVSMGINVTNGTVTGTTCHDNFYGIKAVISTGFQVDHNTVYNTTSFGIDMDTNVFNAIVEHNEIYAATGPAIAMEGTTAMNSIVRYNLIHDCSNAGVMVDTSSEVSIYYNVIYNSYGIMCVGGVNNFIYNNVIYNSQDAGIDLESTSTGNTIRNNIVRKSTNAQLYSDASSTGNTLDYNNWYTDGGSATFRWLGVSKAYATYRTDSGQDAHSITSDPLFINTAGHNFNLQAASLCINAGVSVSLTADYNGTPISGNPDIGAYELAGGITARIAGTGAVTGAMVNSSMRAIIAGNGTINGDLRYAGLHRFTQEGLAQAYHVYHGSRIFG